MELLLSLLAIAYLLAPIIALILALRARRRVDRLERDVHALRVLLERQRRQTDFSAADAHIPAVPPDLAADLPAMQPAPPDEAPRHPSDVMPASAIDQAAVDAAEAPQAEAAEAPPEVEPAAEPAAGQRPHAPPLGERPAPPRSRHTPALSAAQIEERIGGRIAVWLGAIAFFLAVAFLVKYTFDQGLLTPTARVVLGLSFGVALLIAGEWLRTRTARIAQGLTAAGVADIFASLLAAVNLYHLIGPTAGFVLLAANTALAVLLSLRQGPFVALLGLLGGYATPALIGATEPQPGPLFGYLLALQLGLLWVTRRRKWWPLAGLALAGSLLWVGLWLLTSYEPAHSVWLGPFLIISALSFMLATRVGAPSTADPLAWSGELKLSIFGGLAAVLMLAVLVGMSGFRTLDWVFLGCLGAGGIVLGRIDWRYTLLPLAAACADAILLTAWAADVAAPPPAARFALTTLALGLLYLIGPYAALWGSRAADYWAGLAGLATLGHLIIARAGAHALLADHTWGLIGLAVTAVLALAAIPPLLRRMRGAEFERAGDLLSGAAALTLGVAAAFAYPDEPNWLATLWAAEVPLIVWTAGRLRLPILRGSAWLFGAVIVLWQLVRLGFAEPVEPRLLWNWIVYGYAGPALLLGLAAWLARRSGSAVLSRALEGAALWFAFLFVTLEVRHYFHPSQLLEAGVSLSEWGTYVSAWLVLACILLLAGRRWTKGVLAGAGELLGGIAAATCVLALALGANPLLQATQLSQTLIFNELLYVYGLPAALLGMVAALLREGRPAKRMVGTIALLMLFLLVTLEVRHFFHPEQLRPGPILLREWATYVCAWLVLAIALAAAGRRWTGGVAAVGGEVVIVLAAAAAAIMLAFAENPMLRATSVGETRIFNDLLYVYGLPAALLAAVTMLLPPRRSVARLAGICGLLMLFLLVTLEVRQWFRGPILTGPPGTGAESYAYSAVWAALGLALLLAAILTRGPLLRWASLAVMLLAVGKVFLYDTAKLRDLYRVFSLLGLGVSLMLLAFLYQRFVFARPARPAPA